MTKFIDYFFMCGLSETKDAKLYKIHEDGSASGKSLNLSLYSP